MTITIESIRALVAAATPGPWGTDPLECEGRLVYSDARAGEVVAIASYETTLPKALANAALIKAAPEALAFLLGEVERLTVDRDEWQQCSRDWRCIAKKAEADRDALRAVVRLAADERHAFDTGAPCRHTRADMAAALDAAKGGG